MGSQGMAMETGNERQCFGDKIPPAAPPGAPPSGVRCALLASAAVIWVLELRLRAWCWATDVLHSSNVAWDAVFGLRTRTTLQQRSLRC